MINRILKFGLVGIIAMLIHWLIVILIVADSLTPLFANVIGFLVAFNVSYFGHRYWTFQLNSYSMGNKQAFIRFFVVAFSSFLINEFLYYLLLSYTTLNYMTALAIVLVCVAIFTFISSNLWVFK